VARSAHRCAQCGGVVKSRMSSTPVVFLLIGAAILVLLVLTEYFR